MIKKHKVNIFLIKERYARENHDNLLKEEYRKFVKGNYTLYFKSNNLSVPSWTNFFTDLPNEEKNKLSTKNVSAICFRKVGGHTFALTFGHGRYLLKDFVFENDFGLKIALNIINEEKIKKISTKNFSGIPKDFNIQSSKRGNARIFNIDEYTNILKDIYGKVDEDHQKIEYGFDKNTSITGSSSFSVLLKGDIEDVDSFLEKYYKLYKRKDYIKKGFEWVDYIKKVDEVKKMELDTKLIEKIKSEEIDSEDIWAAVPEILDWENVSHFKYKREEQEDVDLNLILGNISTEDKKNINIDFLTKQEIKCLDNNNKKIKSWAVYNTLNAEVDEKGSKFVLSDGNWYKISKDFVEETKEKFKNIKEYGVELPDYEIKTGESKKEFNYNKMLSEKINGLLLDRKNLGVGGGRSKYEVCDVLSKDAFIHSKIYGGSGVLSHLFSQGANSAQILKELKQRKTANKLISSPEYELKEDPSSTHSVVFVIITERKSKEDWTLPFFSQISIVNAHSVLKKEGYKMFYKFVPIVRGEG